jgi:hypothetical protein
MPPGFYAHNQKVGDLAKQLDELFPTWALKVDPAQLDDRDALAQLADTLRAAADDCWRRVELIRVSTSDSGTCIDEDATNAAWQHEIERRTCEVTVRQCPCGTERTLIAESPTGLKHASAFGPWVNTGIAVARYRCASCGSESHIGWLPPTWINAIDRAASRIRTELQRPVTDRTRLRHPTD